LAEKLGTALQKLVGRGAYSYAPPSSVVRPGGLMEEPGLQLMRGWSVIGSRNLDFKSGSKDRAGSVPPRAPIKNPSKFVGIFYFAMFSAVATGSGRRMMCAAEGQTIQIQFNITLM